MTSTRQGAIAPGLRADLVVLDDKEKAAYFLNDLEAILEIGSDEKEQEKTPVLFFPRTARLAYDVETTQNANIAIRTEVLNKLQNDPINLILIMKPRLKICWPMNPIM